MEFGICSNQTLHWFLQSSSSLCRCNWAHLQRRSGWGRSTTHLNFKSPFRSGAFGEVVLSNSQGQTTTVDVYGRLNLLEYNSVQNSSAHACMQLSWINVPAYSFFLKHNLNQQKCLKIVFRETTSSTYSVAKNPKWQNMAWGFTN